MSRRFHIFHHVTLQSSTDLCHGDPSLDLNWILPPSSIINISSPSTPRVCWPSIVTDQWQCSDNNLGGPVSLCSVTFRKITQQLFMFTCPKTGLLLDTNHLTRIQYKGLELAADPDSHFWQCPGSAFCWFPPLGDSVIERSSHRREASRGRSKGIQGQGRGPLSPPGPGLWQLPWVWCLSGSCFQPGCLCRSFSGIATIPNKPSSKFTKWV